MNELVGLSAEERALVERMAEDAAANGDHEGAADLYGMLGGDHE